MITRIICFCGVLQFSCHVAVHPISFHCIPFRSIRSIYVYINLCDALFNQESISCKLVHKTYYNIILQYFNINNASFDRTRTEMESRWNRDLGVMPIYDLYFLFFIFFFHLRMYVFTYFEMHCIHADADICKIYCIKIAQVIKGSCARVETEAQW